MRRDIIHVPDLTDSPTTDELIAAIEEMIGVEEAEADPIERQVAVTYDEGWVGEAGVMGLIQDAGFSAPDAPTRREEV